MKTLFLALTTGALVLFGAAPSADARHRYYGNRTYIANYARCGCPVYATRYVAYYDYRGRPVWRTRYLPIRHRCYRNYGYYPRNYGYYSGSYYGGGYHNPYYYRSGYYRPGITIRF